MGHGSPPRWDYLVFWLIAGVIALAVLSSVLPRVTVPIMLIAGAVAVLRLVWYFTSRY